MVLHAPSIHFHLGAWAVSVLCVGIAILLEIILKFFKSRINDEHREKMRDYVDKLDFTAHVSGVIGFIGIIASSVAGVLDVSGYPLESLELDNMLEAFSIDALLAGFDNSIMSEALAFKIVWTIIGLFFFLFLGAIRIYFVNYRHERMYDQRISVLLLYIFSAVVGFWIMIVVAGAGGALVVGKSLLNLTPITAGFLPGEPFMPALIVASTLFSTLVLVWMWIRPYKRDLPQMSK